MTATKRASKLVKATGKVANLTNAGKGRKRGVPNKTTASVKEALTLAFEGVGGVPKLITFGRDNPAAFYALWAKMLPADVKLGGELSLNGVVILPALTQTAPK